MNSASESIDALVKAWAEYDDATLLTMRDWTAPDLRASVDAVLAARGGRWAAFSADERSDIHNALVLAGGGSGTHGLAPGLIDEIRDYWERTDP